MKQLDPAKDSDYDLLPLSLQGTPFRQSRIPRKGWEAMERALAHLHIAGRCCTVGIRGRWVLVELTRHKSFRPVPLDVRDPITPMASFRRQPPSIFHFI